MRYIFTVACLLIFQSIAVFSQKAPIKFGKIPPEDLAMTVYPPDTAAAAVVLANYGNIGFIIRPGHGLTSKFTQHKRIKLLKQAGFDEGDIVISYYSKDKMEKLEGLKVSIFAPDGSETELPKKEVFEEKVNENYSRVRFSCPNLQVGSVIEYTYDITSDNIFSLPDWYFQEDIPVRWSELRLEIPEFFEYVFLTRGGPFEIAEHSNKLEQMLFRGQSISVKMKTSRFAVKEAPGLKEEPYITSMDDYYTSIKFQLSTVTYPGETTQNIMSSWPNVAEELLSRMDFGDQISKKRFYDKAWEAVSPQLAASSNQTEKANLIYKFVCNNLKVSYTGGLFVSESLNDCFEKKSGRKHELNLLLIALLREAGIEAHPVLLSTRSHGRMFDLYPFIDQFNHVMVYANLDGTTLLMDAGNSFRPMGFPDVSSLNSMGWVVQKDNPQWIAINPPAASRTYLMNMALEEDGSLSGTITMSCDGYSAIEERGQWSEKKDGSHVKANLLERFPEGQVDSIVFDNLDNLVKPLKTQAKCRLPNMATVNGDFIYLAPALMGNYHKNPFKLDQRLYPVDYYYPFKERIILNVALPPGYNVEELPEPINLVLPNDGGSFKFQMAKQASGLQLISNVHINQMHFEPEEYATLRNFFGMVAEKMDEQLVLKKG